MADQTVVRWAVSMAGVTVGNLVVWTVERKDGK